MKKLMVTIASAAMLFTASFAGAQQIDLGVGLGTIYHTGLKDAAFDSTFDFDFNINEYFALGLQTGFGWVKNERSTGTSAFAPGITLTSKERLNIYSIPVLATATLNIPLGEFDFPIVPFITGGVGYQWSIVNSNYIGTSNTKTFHGIAWQATGGVPSRFQLKASP